MIFFFIYWPYFSQTNKHFQHFRVAVLDKVTDFLLFLGKLLVVGLVGESTSCRPMLRPRWCLCNEQKWPLLPQESLPSSSSLGEWRPLRTRRRTCTTTGFPSWYAEASFCPLWELCLQNLREKNAWKVRFLPQTVAVGSFLIASGFFSVYSMCVDTLFLCFCKWPSLLL